MGGEGSGRGHGSWEYLKQKGHFHKGIGREGIGRVGGSLGVPPLFTGQREGIWVKGGAATCLDLLPHSAEFIQVSAPPNPKSMPLLPTITLVSYFMGRLMPTHTMPSFPPF